MPRHSRLYMNKCTQEICEIVQYGDGIVVMERISKSGKSELFKIELNAFEHGWVEYFENKKHSKI
jgi:hypothetical protein